MKKSLIAGAAVTALAAQASPAAEAQGSGKIEIGLMLPGTGSFAGSGSAIENGAVRLRTR